MCHKFCALTVFRSSTLVLALAPLQRFWGGTWLPCRCIFKSSGNNEFYHHRRTWYQVGSQYPLFLHCNLWRQFKKNRKMEIVFSKFCGREKGGVISGLILITFSTSSSFLPLIYLVLYSLNRQKSQILRFCSLKSIAFTIHLC